MASMTSTTISMEQRIVWDSFGPFFRRMRKRRGISQENLSRLLGCHRTYIYRLEHGERHPSRLFLRLLIQVCMPSEEELATLRRFELLRQQQCDLLEQGE